MTMELTPYQEYLLSLDRVSPEQFVHGLVEEFTGDMNEIYGRMIAKGDLWDFGLDLAFHEDPKVAFRGSWALEWAYYNDREAFLPYMQHFVKNFLTVTNPSAHRHYTKMMWDMQHRGMLTLTDDQAEAVAEKAFDLLINPDTKVAVVVWCMEILYDLSPRLGWVEEQLDGVVRRMMENDPSRGIANRGAKLLRRMDNKLI